MSSETITVHCDVPMQFFVGLDWTRVLVVRRGIPKRATEFIEARLSSDEPFAVKTILHFIGLLIYSSTLLTLLFLVIFTGSPVGHLSTHPRIGYLKIYLNPGVVIVIRELR